MQHQVPTFAQGRTDEVRYGVLMSMAPISFNRIGSFYAEILAQIVQGAKPRDLPQVFENSQEIAINIETARSIQSHFPIDVIAGAKHIYEQIENAPLNP